MQVLGSHEDGRMLFLRLGTGLGSALVVGGSVEPPDLAHLPYRGTQSYEDVVGRRALARVGRVRWQRAVAEAVRRLRRALEADSAVPGGRDAEQLDRLPPDTRRGRRADAFTGGLRLSERGPDARAPSA